MFTRRPRIVASPFEGAIARTTVCGRCGYVTHKQKIIGGGVVCPECGYRTPYALTSPDRRWLAFARWFRIVVFAGIVAMMLILTLCGK